ncbi:MAG: hypothetical protein QGI83_23425, partial [Candidatus Latescibacteria bacterium]|nr:hypothetical protein [Candidatus Latescibacterota bacterium]
MSAALDNRPLDFTAYRRDPLARLVLDRAGWDSWQFPVVYTLASIILLATAMLVYLVRDGSIDVARLGGYQGFLPTALYNIVAFYLGSRFYLYFCRQSGRLYQDLADRGVIAESPREIEMVRGAEHTPDSYHRRGIWPLVGVFLGVGFLITMLYSVLWDPDRDEVARYTVVYVAFMLPVWVLGMYMIGMVCARFLSTIWGLSRRLTDADVEIHPLHPDSCGGLRPILDYSLSTSYLIAMLAVGFVIWAFSLTQVWEAGRVSTDAGRILEFPSIWFGAALYVVLAPVAFFGILWTAHRPMSEQKAKMLAQLSDEFTRNHKEA